MLRSLRRAAAIAAVAALAGVASPVDAQTGTGTPTVSTAPSPDALDTTAPRRRPVTRRTRPTPRRQARRDTIEVPVAPVSSRPEMRPMTAESNTLRIARLDRSLRDDAPNWLGIPYRWGGTTRRGIDCSAFVRQYVGQNLGIELPRTTASQRYEGLPIERDELQAGDLVFFRRRGVRHVGVYLSGGDFIHASSSEGVTVSNLSSSYWDRHYWMSRRILSEPSGRMPTPRFRQGEGSRG